MSDERSAYEDPDAGRGYSRYSRDPVGGLAGRDPDSPSSADSRSSGSPSDVAGSWAQDAEDQFNSARQGAQQEAAEAIEQYRDPVEDLAPGTYAHDEGLGETTRELKQGLRASYGEATEGMRSRIQSGMNTLADSGKSLSEDAQGMARKAVGGLGHAATELNQDLRSGYSRFSPSRSEGEDATIASPEGPARDAPGYLAGPANSEGPERDADGSQGSDPRTSQFGGEYGEYREYQGPSTADSGSDAGPRSFDGSTGGNKLATPPQRSTRPWRPGSTGSFTGDDFGQARPPADRRDADVAPAAYSGRVPAQDRLAPRYR